MKRLVLDVADWTAAGEQLLERDPTRFAAILAMVRDINTIKRDTFAKADEAKQLLPAVGKQRGVA